MKVGWLIDADLIDRYRDELVTAIRELGHDAKLIHAPSPPYQWDDIGCSYRETYPREACVITHGDIDLVTRIHNERRWTPGAFSTIEHFAYSNYACQYGRFLLNRDYMMLPFGELERCHDFLFRSVGLDDRIFIRPDSPLKLFTGQVASRSTFSADLEFMGFYEFPSNSLVVVGSPRMIVSEWRFVIADGKDIAGCQYKRNGEFECQSGYDGSAIEFAKSIAELDYQPDPVWVMDICKTSDNSYHLLEIGAFSLSNLYACNMVDVAAAVSSVAKSVWERRAYVSTT